MKVVIISIVILFAAAVGVIPALALQEAYALQDAGAGSAEAPPSTTIDDPIVAPSAAWDDLKAARKTSWPLAVLAGLIMLARLAGSAGSKMKALAWLGKGKAAFAAAGVLAVATAAFDVLALGGSWVSVLTAAAAAGFALMVPTPTAKPSAV